ncbi:MAG TPA: hypothetical protein VH442_21460, partial [Micromonosporaceae bacterium]
PVVVRLRPVARRGLSAATAVVLALAVTSTALSYPRSMAWTAPGFGPSYAIATDSNVDWGQGLYELQSWSKGRDPFVAYFGPRGITTADIASARPLIGANPADITGWVAASATAINSSDRSELAWLRNYCPVRILANSVLVNRFAQPPEVAPAPAKPATLCAGPFSHRAGQTG